MFPVLDLLHSDLYIPCRVIIDCLLIRMRIRCILIFNDRQSRINFVLADLFCDEAPGFLNMQVEYFYNFLDGNEVPEQTVLIDEQTYAKYNCSSGFVLYSGTDYISCNWTELANGSIVHESDWCFAQAPLCLGM